MLISLKKFYLFSYITQPSCGEGRYGRIRTFPVGFELPFPRLGLLLEDLGPEKFCSKKLWESRELVRRQTLGRRGEGVL